MFSCAHIRINFFPLIFTAYKRFWRFFPAVHFSTCINSDSSKIYRFSCLRRELTIERERRYFPWHFGNVCLYGLKAVLVDLSVNTFEESSMKCKIKRHIFFAEVKYQKLKYIHHFVGNYLVLSRYGFDISNCRYLYGKSLGWCTSIQRFNQFRLWFIAVQLMKMLEQGTTQHHGI